MIVLHHDDLDGRLSAAILKSGNMYAKFIELNYSSDVPFDKIKEGEPVFIVDFSLQKPGDWHKLWEITKNIVWIDHHETSIDKSKDIVLEQVYRGDGLERLMTVSDLDGMRDEVRCGAFLTWNWLYGSEKPVPNIVQIVDRWDRWVHEDKSDVLDFVAGSKVVDTTAESDIWPQLLFGNEDDPKGEHLFSMISDGGKVIREYEKRTNTEAVRRFSYHIDWEGYDCVVLHTDKAGSKVFDSLPGHWGLFICVNFDGKKYTVHLYSEELKVNDIAVKYGGGGHSGAAGFVCDELPWRTK